jgi:hypothetical protein
VLREHYGALLSGYRIYRRPQGAKADSTEDLLLPHPSDPLLPLSIHRPLAWDPVRKMEYRFIDSTLPYSEAPARWIYRIVPFNARSGKEGEKSVLEVELSVSPQGVEIIRGGETSPRELRDEIAVPRTDEDGRLDRDNRIKRAW